MSIRRIAAVALALCTTSARADVTITIEQVGNDVVATASGSIDLTGLTELAGAAETSAAIHPSHAFLALGSMAFTDQYSGITGPSSFGTGPFTSATTASGNTFWISGETSGLNVPVGYVSGTQLSATDTFQSQTITGLGLTPGTDTYTWGTGGPDHTLTVQIGPAATAVPEPSSALLAGFGALAGLGVWARRRRARQ